MLNKHNMTHIMCIEMKHIISNLTKVIIRLLTESGRSHVSISAGLSSRQLDAGFCSLRTRMCQPPVPADSVRLYPKDLLRRVTWVIVLWIYVSVGMWFSKENRWVGNFFINFFEFTKLPDDYHIANYNIPEMWHWDLSFCQSVNTSTWVVRQYL